jgi:multiple sugar transport system permease protein
MGCPAYYVDSPALSMELNFLDFASDCPYHDEPRMNPPSLRRRTLRETLTGYLFIAPSLAVIGVFGIFPVIYILYVSFQKWRLARVGFSGLDNYARLFGGNLLILAACMASIGGLVLGAILLRRRAGGRGAVRLAGGLLVLVASLAALAVTLPLLATQGDKEVFDSLRVTIWYSIATVPVQLVGGVALAVFLTRRMIGKQAFRVVYLLPYIAPTVATAAVFELLFSLRPDSFANQVLHLLGAAPLQWLQEPKGIFQLLFGVAPSSAAAVIPAYWTEWAQGPSLALGSIILYSWWVFVGYYALIYMNGLSAIPRQLYEAAEVDGASRLRSFFSITVPLLSPTTYFLTMLGVIGTFKAFNHLYVLRNAAASSTVDAISVSIFFTAFRKGNMGYAAAISILLFLIVLGLTIIQQRTAEKDVRYGD